MRFMRPIVTIVISCLLATVSAAQDQKDAGPLTLRLIPRRVQYPVAKGADQHCFVAIDVELKNVGKEKLSMILAPEPVLELTGPRPEAVRKGGGHMYYVPQERARTLAPGETERVTLRTLTYRIGAGQHHVAWLEPGEYVLRAVYTISASPPPPGSTPGRLNLQSEGKIDEDNKFGVVVIKSEPIKLTMREGSVADYWTDALKDDDLEIRRMALVNLRVLGVQAQGAGKVAVGMLAERDPDLRAKAIEALVAFGPTVKAMALPELLKALNDGDKSVKVAAIQALAQVAADDKSVAPAILPFLRERDKDLRLTAVNALGFIASKQSRARPKDATALLAALKVEKVEDVRRGIIEALHHHPSLEVLHALIPHLRGGDKHTRIAAYYAAGHLAVFAKRDAEKEEKLGHPHKQAVAALTEELKDHEQMPYAIHGLRQFRADAASAVPTLLELLDDPRNQSKDSIHHPRVWIVQAFRDIGPGAKAATRALAMRLLTDPDWSVRQYAAQALGNIGADPREAGPALNQALKDKMVQVRQEAPPALAKIGAVPELLDGLNDDNPETRRSVINALGTMKEHSKPIVPALVKSLREDADAKNRSGAAYALGALGSAAAVPGLAIGLKDADFHVRLGAVEAFRMLGPSAREGIPALFELVKTDRKENAREKACWALVTIDIKGEKAFVPALIDMIADKNQAVAYPAIYLLGQLGPDARGARNRLQEIANTQKGHPADAAREALRRIGP